MGTQRQFVPRPRILCVDDGENNLQLRKAFLEHFGCEVIAVLDAGSALRELTKQGKVDLVLLDYHLRNHSGAHLAQDNSGANLAQDIRTILPSLPLIMLTGDPMVPDSEKSTVDLWFIKGQHSPDDLLGAIERLIPGTTLRLLPVKKAG